MADQGLLARLGEVLAAELPITQSLGIRVESRSGGGLVLWLPLAVNRNHKGAVFAGSLNAVATLAGWGALWLALAEAGTDAHVVIQDSTIRYPRPARSDVRATCAGPLPAALEQALDLLRRRGRARLALASEVHDAEGTPVAGFSGRYVLHRPGAFG